MSQSSLLSLQEIGFERDDLPLFSNISITISSGDILQVLGANGAGKTTLLRIMATSLHPSSGEMYWQDQPVARCRLNYLTDMLFIGHNAGVKPALTTRENLHWWCSLQGVQLHVDALQEVGLDGYQDTPCYQLSAGQMRRVALARLLVSPAKLWILDEPYTAIDSGGVELLENLFQKHTAKGGAVVISSHQQTGMSDVLPLNLADFQPQVVASGVA